MTRGQRMSSVGPYLPWNGLVDPGDLGSVGGRAAAAWGYAGGTSGGFSIILDAEDAGTTPFQFDSITSGSGNDITESTVWKSEGSYSYLFTHTSGSLSANYGVKAFTPLANFYITFHLYFEAATWNPGAYWHILYLDDDTTTPVLFVLSRQLDGSFGYSVYVNEATDSEDEVLSHPGQSKIPAGVDTKVGLLYRRGVSGGAAVWINDVFDDSNFTRDTTAYNPIQTINIGNNYSTSPGADGDYFYMDDIRVTATSPSVGGGLRRIFRRLIRRAVTAGGRRWR